MTQFDVLHAGSGDAPREEHSPAERSERQHLEASKPNAASTAGTTCFCPFSRASFHGCLITVRLS